jgi:hypothetical protein
MPNFLKIKTGKSMVNERNSEIIFLNQEYSNSSVMYVSYVKYWQLPLMTDVVGRLSQKDLNWKGDNKDNVINGI